MRVQAPKKEGKINGGNIRTVKPQTLEPDVLGKRWKKAILTDGGAKR
jgi:hypothetical protein